MARRKKSSDEGGGAYWMDTYGDLVTLLLCFFVLLFSFSSMDAAKWESLKGAFTGAAVITIPILDPDMAFEKPIESILKQNEKNQDGQIMTPEQLEAYHSFHLLIARVQGYIDENEVSADISANFDRYILTVRFSENIFFDSGKAVIRTDAREALDNLITLLVEMEPYYSEICIEGHTDNRPIHTAEYDSNWELSVFRAVNTLRYILSKTESMGLLENKISATGYGETRPVSDNISAEGRAKNRRVDFVIQANRPPEQQLIIPVRPSDEVSSAT